MNLVGNWKTLGSYDAHTTNQEKINRVANHLTFGVALYGVYSCFTGGVGFIPFAGMALAARKVASTVIGYQVYPAALSSLNLGPKGLVLSREEYEATGAKQLDELRNSGFYARRISICKSGVRFDAALIGHSSTIDNGKWTLHALGNGMAMECFFERLARENERYQSNTLLINGPSVSGSGGWPTRYQMGAGFEAGIQFLEREVKATHIVMRGLSLGGGMMAEAILNHDFSERETRQIHYLFISDRTFSKLSTIVEHFLGTYVEQILRITDTELDGEGAAIRLSELHIRQIVIQYNADNLAAGDGVIPNSSSLAYALHKREDIGDKLFLESDKIGHNGPLPEDIQGRLSNEIAAFFQKT